MYPWRQVACVVNFDVGWARLVQALFVGMYVNGIAVYGRDPLYYHLVVTKESQATLGFGTRFGLCVTEDYPTIGADRACVHRT